MEVKTASDVETLVAAAKVPRRDINAECFMDALEHVAIPRGGFFGADVPKSQIDIEVRAFDGGDLAEVEDVLQISLCSFAGEFCIGVR